MSIRLDEQSIRPLSRTARGVRAIRLREEDQVVSMARLREGAAVMTVTTLGQGRRTPIEEYRLQSRGGYGKINYKVNDKKGQVAGVRVVDETDDLILIADDGVIIRIRVSDVNLMSRYASGVRVMRLAEGSKLVTFARAEHDDQEEIESVETASGEDLTPQELEALAQEEAALDSAPVPEEE